MVVNEQHKGYNFLQMLLINGKDKNCDRVW